MKRNQQKIQQQTNESENRKSGCLTAFIIFFLITVLILFSYKSLKRDISNIISGAADVNGFFEDIKHSYKKNITSPDFILPLNGNITSFFGERKSPFDENVTEMHTGIDIDTNISTDVFSSEKGVVSKAGYDERMGNYLIIKHNDIYSTCYAHLEGAIVKENDEVEKGEKIAVAGETGRTTGKHLHFEIRREEERMDPMKYLSE